MPEIEDWGGGAAEGSSEAIGRFVDIVAVFFGKVVVAVTFSRKGAWKVDCMNSRWLTALSYRIKGGHCDASLTRSKSEQRPRDNGGQAAEVEVIESTCMSWRPALRLQSPTSEELMEEVWNYVYIVIA